MSLSIKHAIADYYSESQVLVDRALASYIREEIMLEDMIDNFFDMQI